MFTFIIRDIGSFFLNLFFLFINYLREPTPEVEMISGAYAQISVSLLMEKIDKLAAEVEHLRTSQNSVIKHVFF